MTADTRGSRVLVAAASKHRATTEIAEQIGETLRDRGCDVTVAAAGQVDTVDGCDATVLGRRLRAWDAIAASDDKIADTLQGASARREPDA